MKKMLTMNATRVRSEWSSVVDSVIREKPKFIKRTRDTMFLANVDVMESLLSGYRFTADIYPETDGSVTMALREIDLAENGADPAEAKRKLAEAILDYAEDFYNEYTLWSSAPNRKPHIPYVIKALIIGDAEGIVIECLHGET